MTTEEQLRPRSWRDAVGPAGWMRLAAMVLAALFFPGLARGIEEAPPKFNRDIRPLLSDRCFSCHGPDGEHRQAGLRLDTEEGARADLGGYAAVVPGDPESSALVARVFSEDPDQQMPPPEAHKGLEAEERELLRRWIAAGAPWEAHWAYVAPRATALPEVRDQSWPLDPIDHYVLAEMEATGLSPSPEAERAPLLRRLSLDLTGLPPGPAETRDFLQDTSPEAYERLVDGLLASEHYGERMAMYWLDLVRYADTVGYHGDQDHHISPYRDYVIEAFQENVSFDRFTREQLAGDLLAGATVDQKVASGYNRLLQTSHEGGVQPKEYLAIYAADRVRNVSSVWMGATLGCAQCHDHKYDPYTIGDFYAMSAFFADIDEEAHFKVGTNALPTRRPPEIEVLSKRERRRLAAVEAELASCEGALASCLPAAEAQRRQLREKREALLAEREAVRAGARTTMITVALPTPRVTRVLPRGNWLDDSGEVVEPAVPAFLGKLETEGRRATRLDLARWLTDGESDSGKLTARVMVNRLWYLLFGAGLSRSLEDFGGQGRPPEHPELLDHLALSFIDSGWDVKAMMKRLVMSRTYRQSSEVSESLRKVDPTNRYYARQASFRLPAEMIRDGALSMSGLLQREIGGPSVKPYQPEGYYRHLNFPQRSYTHDQDERQWRRGIYVHWQRQFLHPMLKAFDAPTREECTAMRSRSNTPTAALTLLNDPTFVEAARVMAARVLREAPDDSRRRLHYAFLLALCREPGPEEESVLLALLEAERTEYASDPRSVEALLGTGQAAATEEVDQVDQVEQAAWTAVTRVLLNLDETISRR